MILPFFKIPSPSTRRRKMIEVLETKSETIVKYMEQVSRDADKTVLDGEDAACKIYEASSNRNRRRIMLENELNEIIILEQKLEQDLKNIKLEEKKLTKKYRKIELDGVNQQKILNATKTSNEWERTLEKWKNRLEKAISRDNEARKLAKELGVTPISTSVTAISGLSLQVTPTFEGVIHLPNFQIGNWKVSEISSLEPRFTGTSMFIENANLRKDLFYTLILARRLWLEHIKVQQNRKHESSISSEFETSKSGLSASDRSSSFLFGDNV